MTSHLSLKNYTEGSFIFHFTSEEIFIVEPLAGTEKPR